MNRSVLRDWIGGLTRPLRGGNLLSHASRRKTRRRSSHRLYAQPLEPRRVRFEPLEDRCVLAPIVLGVVGDSLSDEYLEETYDYASNWVEILADQGIADLGQTASEAGQPGGTWGEPRRTGYEQNWARAGAVTADLFDQEQVQGLVGQVEVNDITHIVLMIGANDFAPRTDVYEDLYNGWITGDDIQDDIEDNLNVATDAIDALNATGARLVIATLPDYGVAPYTQALYPNGVFRDRVTTVIRDVNEQLVDIVMERGIPIVDVFGMSKAVFGENTDPRSSIKIGDVDIQLQDIDTTSGTNPTAAFVHDGMHPNTVIQAWFSHMFMYAFNLGYGDNIPLISEEQALEAAGIPGYGEDTLMDELGIDDYSVFVFLPSVNADIAGRLGDGRWYVAASTGDSFDTQYWGLWGAGNWTDVMSGDFNGDGQADVAGRLGNLWYVGLNTGTSFSTTYWGLWGAGEWTDVLVGDFTGNGRDDIAGRFNNRWYVASSTGSSFQTSYWGIWGAGDWTDVMVGDFTGNGRADIAGRFDNRWYVAASTGSAFQTTYWGLWGPGAWTDVLVGDFTGDGRADIAGRLNNRWHVASSTGSSFQTTYWGLWGSATWNDVRVGDFNGDGRDDIAGRLNDGRWFVARSEEDRFQTDFWGLWDSGLTWLDVLVDDFRP